MLIVAGSARSAMSTSESVVTTRPNERTEHRHFDLRHQLAHSICELRAHTRSERFAFFEALPRHFL